MAATSLWDRVFRINVTALMCLTRAVVLASAGGWSALQVAAPKASGRRRDVPPHSD
ncbi:hypothetical protein ACX80V_12105 [Arthrobacter sp. MDT3-24]